MSGRIGVWLMRSLAWMPLPWLRGLGAFLGRVLFVLAAPRRKVALRNLALCFPELTEAQRVELARSNFIVFCQTWLDRSWLWAAPREVVAERVKLQGAVHELDGDTPHHPVRAAFLQHGRGWPGAAAAHHAAFHLDLLHPPGPCGR